MTTPGADAKTVAPYGPSRPVDPPRYSITWYARAMAQRSPEDIASILCNFLTAPDKLEALKILTGSESGAAPDPNAAAKIAELETLVAELREAGEAALDEPALNRRQRTLFANMAASLGYEDAEQLRLRPPLGADEPGISYALPGGEATNSCEEARALWRVAALNLVGGVRHLAQGPPDSWPWGDVWHGEKDPRWKLSPAFLLAVEIAWVTTYPKMAVAS